MARAAETAGFDSVWVGDHLLYREPDGTTTGPWEVWSTLAALSAVTEVVQLGPLVAATSFHHPAMLAKKAATVDEVSNARLVLGLGAGWNRIEYDAFGFPYDHRATRFLEAFEIIRRLLGGERVSFEGRYYRVRDCELMPPSANPNGGPPLLVGSPGPRMLRATLPHIDQWNAWFTLFGNRVEGLPPLFERLDAACEEVGRDPATLVRTVALLVRAPGGTGRRTGDPEKAGDEPIAGDPSQVAEALAGFAEAGVHQVQLVLDPIEQGAIEGCGAVIEQLETR